ncbi:serine/threonine-protein kinase pim-1-like [Odontesthes bonariensis]
MERDPARRGGWKPKMKPQMTHEVRHKEKQLSQLGEGGCVYVFAGLRTADNLPVAIKHIPVNKVFCKHVDKNGKQLPNEVVIMSKFARSTGTSAPVSLLDWYDLGEEVLLVLERPTPSDFYRKMKLRQVILKHLVKCIFQRDLKAENILIETSSDVPRVRLIDFGQSCFTKKQTTYGMFFCFAGTPQHVPTEWYSCYSYRTARTSFSFSFLQFL